MSSYKQQKHLVKPGLKKAEAPAAKEMTDSPSNQAMLDSAGLNESAGSAQSLPEDMRARLEQHFGYGLQNLQVRESQEAGKLGGKAFTKGNVVHFQPGILQGRDPESDMIIAHEVSHAVSQATEARYRGGEGEAVMMDPLSERAADQSARGFLAAGETAAQPAGLQALPAAPTSAPAEGWGFKNMLAKKERGHDLIMQSARSKANEKLSDDKQYSARDLNNMDYGTFFNDIGPNKYGKTKDGRATPGTRNQIKFGVRYKAGRDKSRFVAQTHTGNLQFLHGMKSTSDKNQLDTNRKLNSYSKLAYGLGSGGSVEAKLKNNENDKDNETKTISLDTPVSELIGTEFEELGFQDVSDFYGDGRLRTKLRKQAKAEQNRAAYEAKADPKSKKDKKKLAKLKKKEDKRRKKVTAYREKHKDKDGVKGMTLREMIGVRGKAKGTENEKEEKNAQMNRDAQMRYLGSLAHTMQDTFAGSHSMRAFEGKDGEGPVDITNQESVMKGVNPILQHADYTAQDEKKHHAADILAGKDEWVDDPGRVEKTAGATQARDVSAFMMHSAKSNKSWEDMEGFFKQTFALDKDVENSLNKKEEERTGLARYQVPGSGRAYRKQELFEGVEDAQARALLKYYSNKMRKVERGELEGKETAPEFEPTEKRPAQKRINELREQANILIDARNRLSEESEKQENASILQQVGNDLFEIYKSLESLVKQLGESAKNEDIAYVEMIKVSLSE